MNLFLTCSFLITILTAPFCHAEGITARWLGVSGLVITDGETTLIFDPAITKPTLSNWLFNAPIYSEKSAVEETLSKAQVSKAQAIFSSHCHFDHAVDVAFVSEKTGAPVYGGPSLKRIALADAKVKSEFKEITDRTPFQVGKFKIIPIKRDHASIIHALNWKFLPGPVPEDFQSKFYQFHEGEVWAFRLEHPDGNILVDQGSHFFKDNEIYAGKTDAYFLGVANKKSLEDLIQNNINVIRPSLLVPTHFDYFYIKSETLQSRAMPGTDLDQIAKRIAETAPSTRYLIPTRLQSISIPKRVIEAKQ